MSKSQFSRPLISGNVPVPTRRVPLGVGGIKDYPSNLCTTPGGTLYSTTPGGTRLVYEKSFLMDLRNSPLSKSPPPYELPEGLIRNGDGDPHYYQSPQNGGSIANKHGNNAPYGNSEGNVIPARVHHKVTSPPPPTVMAGHYTGKDDIEDNFVMDF